MKKITTLVISILSVFTMLLVPMVATTTVGAQTPKEQLCKGINNSKSGTCATTGTDFGGFIKNIVNILLYIIGAIAVLMIIIGGLRYVISGGDSSQTKGAKDTVLYAVIGLVIAVMSYAIVNFVVVQL
ncbi:MAG: pilin [Candidatus Saccharimonadales bacterium]